MSIMTSSIIDAIGVEFSERAEEITNNVRNLLNGSYFDEMERFEDVEDVEDVDED